MTRRAGASCRPGGRRRRGPRSPAHSRGLNDSKKLDARTAKSLRENLRHRAGRRRIRSTTRIDRDNILRASLWALARAVKSLPMRPKLVFVDGNIKIDCGCDCETVVSRRRLGRSIAAASIVAKVTRDRLMTRLGLAHPGYGFERHMGYSVPEHFARCRRSGRALSPPILAPVAAKLGLSTTPTRRLPAFASVGCLARRLLYS